MPTRKILPIALLFVLCPHPRFAQGASSCGRNITEIDAMVGQTDLMLVDIRSASEFAKYHAEKSINLPAGFLAQKPFLKTVPVLLLDDGYRLHRARDACEKLRQAGAAQVWALEGGLAAWASHRGLVLSGASAVDRPWLSMPPGIFLEESRHSRWNVIRLSASNHPARPNDFAIERSTPALIAAATPDQYAQLLKAWKGRPPQGVYFLDGTASELNALSASASGAILPKQLVRGPKATSCTGR